MRPDNRIRAGRLALAAGLVCALAFGASGFIGARHIGAPWSTSTMQEAARSATRFGADDLGFADLVLSYEFGQGGGGDLRGALRTDSGTPALQLGIGGTLSVAFVDNVLVNSGDPSADLALFGTFDAIELAVRPKDRDTESALRRALGRGDSAGFFNLGKFAGDPLLIDIDAHITRRLPAELRFDALRVRDLSAEDSAGRGALIALSPSSVGGILALGSQALPEDVVSRELSLQIQTAKDLHLPVDVVSRETSVQVHSGKDMFLPLDVISRELSVQVHSSDDDFLPSDVVSREVSVQIHSADDLYLPVDVVSRELSVQVYSFDSALGPLDAISREMSVFVPGGADLRVVSIVAPTSGATDEPVNVTWFVRNAGNGPTTPAWTERVSFSTDGTIAGIVASQDLASSGSLAAGANRSYALSVLAPSTPGTYYVLVQTDATDVVTEEFSPQAETNNLLVASAPIVVQQAPRPALEVVALTPPRSANPSELVEVVWWTRNSGTAAAVGPWTESVVLGDGPSLAGAQSLAMEQVAVTLPVGAMMQRVVHVALPATMPADPWLLVCSNAGSELILLPGAITCASAQICPSCQRPDVVATVVNAPATAFAGTAMNVSWTTRNDGNGDAVAPWTERITLARESDGALVGTWDSTQQLTLASGAERVTAANIDLPADLEGLHRVRVEVDSANQLLEPSGETNNLTVAGQPTDVSQQPRPDLSVAMATLSSATATTGSLVNVTWSVSNSGDAVAVAPWQDGVYLSSHATFDLSTAQLRATYTHASDLAQATSYPAAQVRSVVMPPSAGTYWIFVATDRLGDVEEGSAESNNVTLAGSVTVTNPPRPNLAVTSVVPAPAGAAGSFVSVQWTTVNNGEIGINSGSGSFENAQWNERVYASADASLGNDLLLASGVYGDPLSIGNSIIRTRVVPVPALPAGYYIVVQVDPTNTVPETNESDNFGMARDPSFVVLPNLVTSGVSNPGTGVADASIAVSWTVTNDAADATANASWIDTVYLRALSTGVTQPLGSVVRSAPLGPLAQYTGMLTAALPGYTSGNYELFVLTDSDDAVAETASLDNTSFGTQITIAQPPRPNLVVEAITPPGDDLVSHPFGAAWRVRNIGGTSTSAAFTDRIYAVNVATGTEYSLGFAVVASGLNAGAAVDVSTTATMPSTPGTYWLVVVTDRTNAINEGVGGGEDDNRAMAAGTFHAETFVVTVATPVVAEPTPSIVPLFGTAVTSVRGAPAANVPIDVAIDIGGSRRILQDTTDGNGSFALDFHPIPTEAGQYELRAGPRAQVAPTVTDTFVLYAMTCSPASRSLPVYPEFRPTSTGFALKNEGNTPLVGIATQTSTLPPGVTMDVILADTTIPALGMLAVEVTVEADLSAVTQDLDVELAFTSAEGATVSVELALAIRPPGATLVATQQLVEANVQLPAPGGDPIQTLIVLELTNIGAGISQPVQVFAPAVPWLSLATAMPLDPLLPGESTTITIIASPTTAHVPPGATTSGNFAVVGGVATAFVPFEFHAFLDGEGTVVVRTSDEGTYWDLNGQPLVNGPRVGGATVTLHEHFSNTLAGTVTTGADGLASFADLAPGYYRIRSEAPGHSTNEITSYLAPGETIDREAFMPILGVTYTWNVTPTGIEDQYLISVNTLFQTNVPAPVVTIDPAYVDLDTLAAQHNGQPFQIDYTITNHGLIRADDMVFQPSPPGGYQVEALATQLGDLAAGQSIVVPVVVTPMPALQSGGCYQGTVRVEWTLVCGIPIPYFASGSMHASVNCPPPSPPCSLCVPPGGGDPGGPGGGGTVITPPPPPTVTQWTCDEDCLGAVLGCLPFHDCVHAYLSCGPILYCQANPGECDEQPTPGEIADCAIAALECGGIAVPALWLPDAASCLCSLYKECVADDGWPLANFPCSPGEVIDFVKNQVMQTNSGGALQGAPPSWAGFFGGSIEPVKQFAITQGERLAVIGTFQWYPFGAEPWIAIPPHQQALFSSWREELLLHLAATSNEGVKLSPVECSALLGFAYPDVLTAADLQTFFARWNRTVDYWNVGVYTVDQVPAGFDTDFIDASILSALSVAAHEAQAGAQADGFPGVVEAWEFSRDLLELTIFGQGQGICATVEVQIDQTVTLTRSAFRASIGLDNSSNEVLEVVDVDIEFTTFDGQPANHLFAIQVESTQGIAAFDGTAALLPASEASATWILIPSDDAAPTESVAYSVSGSLSFVRNGVFTLLPLAPIAIQVQPNADLKFSYFVERDVFSDDPFTAGVVEPAVPFDLGLRVVNQGAGSVTNMSIASAQPQIVRNDSGLLIDFQIIGSQVGASPSTPSLTVDMGDFGPGQVNAARWQLISSLQGKFVGFSATVENLNGLSDPEFWVIDPQVDVRPMLRAVRADEGGDDMVFDFLDINPLNTLDAIPERLWTSSGTDVPVNVVSGAVVTPLSGNPPRATVDSQISPVSSNYTRFADPFNGAYVLTGVVRADGKALQLGPNAWQTDRILTAGPSAFQPRIHLFDQGGSGEYTLYFDADIVGPQVLGWSSLSQYGSLGFYTLAITNDGAWVDSRIGGPETIRLVFNEQINPATFTVANVAVTSNIGNHVGDDVPFATHVDSGGVIAEILFLQPIQHGSFVCVTVQGVEDVHGNVMGPQVERLTFFTLVGDLTSDGTVATDDSSLALSLSGTRPVDPGNPMHLRADVDRSGSINATDLLLVKARRGSNVFGVATACFGPAVK